MYLLFVLGRINITYSIHQCVHPCTPVPLCLSRPLPCSTLQRHKWMDRKPSCLMWHLLDMSPCQTLRFSSRKHKPGVTATSEKFQTSEALKEGKVTWKVFVEYANINRKTETCHSVYQHCYHWRCVTLTLIQISFFLFRWFWFINFMKDHFVPSTHFCRWNTVSVAWRLWCTSSSTINLVEAGGKTKKKNPIMSNLCSAHTSVTFKLKSISANSGIFYSAAKHLKRRYRVIFEICRPVAKHVSSSYLIKRINELDYLTSKNVSSLVWNFGFSAVLIFVEQFPYISRDLWLRSPLLWFWVLVIQSTRLSLPLLGVSRWHFHEMSWTK